MKTYAILIQPSFNKVFFESSKQLLQSEIQILDQMVLGNHFHNYALETMGGVDYVTFSTDVEIGEVELAYLSRLSSLYCLFEVVSDAPRILRPVTIREAYYFDEDVISIQKYTGKTNEEFTKMMLNIAVFCSDFAKDFTGRLQLLDPVAGRGTTLMQGLVYGYHVYGIEADKKSTHAMMTFLKRYLMEKHYKHQLAQSKFRRDGRMAGNRFSFEAARTKEEYKENKGITIDVVQDDTRYASEHFKKEMFHIIVGDLPYGVLHGSPNHQGNLTRNPKKMLEESVPIWTTVLKRGGTIAVSWNTKILPRVQIEKIFSDAGLQVLHSDALDKLIHDVDASITRDLLVAKKL